jgi:hypothetical protein
VSAAKSVGAVAPQYKAQDVQQVGFGDSLDGYFTKYFDNPREASQDILAGSKKGRSVWEILDVAILDPNSKERTWWNEYEIASKGMHQIKLSKGLRVMLGMGKPLPDEELAEKEDGFESVLRIERDSVKTLGGMGRMASRVLRLVEQNNLPGALAILDEFGVKYVIAEYGRHLLDDSD